MEMGSKTVGRKVVLEPGCPESQEVPKVITPISKREFPMARVAADSWSTALIQGQAKL